MPSQEPPQPLTPRGALRGIAVGAGALLALTCLKLAFMHSIGAPTPFLLYFGAVLAAAWYGGAGAGVVVAAIAAALGDLFFIEPRVSWLALVQLCIFFVEGVAISMVTGRLLAERRAAHDAAHDAATAADKLDVVLSGVSDGITMQDARGTLLYANDAAAQLTGFRSADEMVRTPVDRILERYEMLREDGSPFPREALPGRVILEGGASAAVTMRFRVRATGDERWSIVRTNAVRDARGAVRYLVNVFQDVTEARKHDEVMSISREWFATALRSIGDAVVTTDQRGCVTFLNSVAEALTGWKNEEASGRPLHEVFRILHETTRDPVESPVERVLRDGVVVGLANHTVLVRRDGSERAIDDSAAPIKSRSGELVGVVLVFRDVSVERRKEARRSFLVQATAELNSSLEYEKTLATVARLAVPAIADWCAVDMTDGDGIKRLAVAHVDPDKVSFVREIERRYPSDPNAPRGVPNILRTGKAEMMAHIPEALLVAGARDEEHLRMIRALSLRAYIGVPIKRGDRTIGAITFVSAESRRDYDEEDLAFAEALGERAAIAIENASLYREAQQLRAEAELASRAKDEFLAMLGHELRNPLAPILTALQLMSLRDDAPFERERNVIERQVTHVVRLVEDLLDVSRITRGKVELAREVIDVGELVARAVEMTAPLIEQRAQQITTVLGDGLFVDGDPHRLAQTLTNILNNAAKYTPKGGHISIVARRDGDSIVFSIRDDGIGIAPEILPRVFDLFVQERQALDRAQGGLGLGLAIVRSIVTLHGGSVEVKSDGIGKGSEVILRLPASAPAAAPSAPAPRPAQVRAAGALRILVVDDNADALEVLAASLEHLGYVTSQALDGAAALVVAAADRPDIAILDIGLPVMDGYELARRLRELDGLGALKLVALTGYGQPSDRARSIAAGFDEHLVKPVTLQAVQDAVERLRTPRG